MTTTTLADLDECRLSWSDDTEPGIRRRRAGRGFSYSYDGVAVRDEAVRARIRALAIPPAWTDVWISASADGHIQAIGRDARGRKQYRYHPRYREYRERAKFEHLATFGRALPRLRRTLANDLRLSGLPREKVLATVVQLLEATLVRVGNEEYAQANQSFGLTTLRRRHARLERGTVRLRFRGKSGREHEVAVADPRLRPVIRKCQELPGQLLFKYADESGLHPISSQDVNEYLRTVTEMDISAKEFRTWFATLLAACELARHPVPDSERDAKRLVTQAISGVSKQLGNTPAICRRSYVHPTVVAAFRSGDLAAQWQAPVARQAGLVVEERRLLALLEGSKPAIRPRAGQRAAA
jgi:DNA topoisomerase I